MALPSAGANPSSRPVSAALFTSSLSGGGAENVFTQLANAFVEKGVAVDLVLLEKKGPYLSRLDPRVRVIDLKAPHGLLSFFPLLRYLRRERPPLLLTTLESPNLVAGILKRLGFFSGQLFINVQNMENILIHNYGWLKRIIFQLLYPAALRAAVRVIAPSNGVRRKYLIEDLGLDPSQTKVIHNSIINDHLKRSLRGPARAKWFSRKLKPYLISVARLEPQKDQAVLLKAFARVRAEIPMKLVLLGEGGERKNLEKLGKALGLGGDLIMPGHQPNPYPFMGQAEVFVLSSKHEGMANVLVEAMACGTPIVSTDCPYGPSEVLEKGKWGRLTPVGDDQTLARAILDTLRKPPRRSASARAAEFEIGPISEEYFQLFRSIPSAAVQFPPEPGPIPARPKISVVIPTYNRPETLSRLLASVARQTYRPSEVIVVDDFSPRPERYKTLIARFKGRLPQLRYLRNASNSGGSYTRNQGILAARYPLIAMSDDDDEWKDQKLEKQVRVFQEHWNDTDLVFNSVLEISDKDGSTLRFQPSLRDGGIKDLLSDISDRLPNPSATLIKRECLLRSGLFDPTLRGCEDWDMWVRILKKGHHCRKVDAFLTIKHLQTTRVSNSWGGKKYFFALGLRHFWLFLTVNPLIFLHLAWFSTGIKLGLRKKMGKISRRSRDAGK